MKKVAFFSLLALSLGFTACDNYEEPNPPAQSNPQEAIFEANGVSFTPQTSVLNLDYINNEGAEVPVATVTTTDFPENYQLQLVMEVAGNDSFDKFESLATSIDEDGLVTVSPATLQDAINKIITKDPAALTASVRFAAYAVNGKTKVRIGDPTTFYCAETLNIIPMTPSTIIEETYYFLYSTDGTEWNVSDKIEIVQAEQGSPYDYPVFTFTYDFPTDMIGEGLRWIVAPGSTVDGGSISGEVFTPAIDEVDAQSGKLVSTTYSADGIAAGVITMEGTVMFTVNMEDRSFNYIQAITSFYTPGDANGWSFPYPVLFTDDYVDYKGLVHLNKQFKFSPEAGWGRDFGQVNNTLDAIAYHEENGVFIGEGKANGGDNIPVAEDGLYYVTLNYPTRLTTLTQIVTVGLIGDFNGWSEQLNMTPNEDFTEWTVEDVTFDADGGWKFRMNDNWGINLGGDVQDLTFGGDNIQITKGTYNIKLILKGQPYAVEITQVEK